MTAVRPSSSTSGPAGSQADPEAILTVPAAVGDAAVGQDHPARRLVAGGAGQQDALQAQRTALGQPGGEHARAVAAATPRRDDVVADVPALAGELHGQLVADDERAEIVLAGDVP